MGNILVFRTVPVVAQAILALAALGVAFWMVFVTIFLVRNRRKVRQMLNGRILNVRPPLDVYHHPNARPRPQK